MKFRNQSNARYLKALFFEETDADKSTVLYTLKDSDHEGYPSLYRLYMESNDPTEYRFATQHLDGWDHWQLLCKCSWFQPYLLRWREEMEIRVRSSALAVILAQATVKGKDGYQASKYLLDGGWKTRNEKGRPSKEQIKRAADNLASVQLRLEEDFDRLEIANVTSVTSKAN